MFISPLDFGTLLFLKILGIACQCKLVNLEECSAIVNIPAKISSANPTASQTLVPQQNKTKLVFFFDRAGVNTMVYIRRVIYGETVASKKEQPACSISSFFPFPLSFLCASLSSLSEDVCNSPLPCSMSSGSACSCCIVLSKN